jgi:hypothetical protein
MCIYGYVWTCRGQSTLRALTWAARLPAAPPMSLKKTGWLDPASGPKGSTSKKAPPKKTPLSSSGSQTDISTFFAPKPKSAGPSNNRKSADFPGFRPPAKRNRDSEVIDLTGSDERDVSPLRKKRAPGLQAEDSLPSLDSLLIAKRPSKVAERGSPIPRTSLPFFRSSCPNAYSKDVSASQEIIQLSSSDDDDDSQLYLARLRAATDGKLPERAVASASEGPTSVGPASTMNTTSSAAFPLTFMPPSPKSLSQPPIPGRVPSEIVPSSQTQYLEYDIAIPPAPPRKSSSKSSAVFRSPALPERVTSADSRAQLPPLSIAAESVSPHRSDTIITSSQSQYLEPFRPFPLANSSSTSRISKHPHSSNHNQASSPANAFKIPSFIVPSSQSQYLSYVAPDNSEIVPSSQSEDLLSFDPRQDEGTRLRSRETSSSSAALGSQKLSSSQPAPPTHRDPDITLVNPPSDSGRALPKLDTTPVKPTFFSQNTFSPTQEESMRPSLLEFLERRARGTTSATYSPTEDETQMEIPETPPRPDAVIFSQTQDESPLPSLRPYSAFPPESPSHYRREKARSSVGVTTGGYPQAQAEFLRPLIWRRDDETNEAGNFEEVDSRPESPTRSVSRHDSPPMSSQISLPTQLREFAGMFTESLDQYILSSQE